jgi:hypothetical protein
MATRRGVWLLTCVLSLALPDVVLAQRPQRIVVHDFDGPNATVVRSHLLRGLRRSRVRIVSGELLDRAAERLGRELTSEDYQSLARALDIDGFLSGDVERRRVWQARVEVRGPDGAPRQPLVVRGRSLSALATGVRNRVPRQLGSALGRPASVEPAAGAAAADDLFAEETERPPPPDLSTHDLVREQPDLDPELYPGAGSEEPRAPFVAEHSPIDVELGVVFINRSFTYEDDAAAPYSLPFGPGLSLGFSYYPGAHFRNNALAGLGLRGELERSFLLRSSGGGGVRYDTTYVTWAIGPRYRIEAGPVELDFDALIAHHGFRIEAQAGDPEPPLASVGYTGLRAGAGLRVRAGRIRFHLGGSYHYVFDTGAIGSQEHHPDDLARGFTAGAGMGYALPHGFEVRAGLDAHVYFHDLGATGSAVDRYFVATVGAAWAFDPTGD